MIYLPVLASSELLLADKVVYAAVSMHCGGLNRPFRVSQAKLAHATNLSTRTVQRSVKNLKQRGLLEACGNGKSNTYRLLTPDSAVAPTYDKAVVSPTTSPSPNPRQGRQVEHKRTKKKESKSVDGLTDYLNRREQKWG